MARRSTALALQVAVALLVLVFVARAFARHWEQFRSSSLDLQLQLGPLVLALLAIWSGYLLLILAWHRMVAGWGEELGFLTAARIWAWSSLGKYLPGKVWAVAGMVAMAREAGVAAWAATGSALLLQGLAMGTGALVVVASYGTLLPDVAGTPFWGLVATVLAAAGLIGLALNPGPLERLVKRFTAREDIRLAPVSLGNMSFGVLGNLVAWLAYGAAVWLMAQAILPAGQPALLTTIAAFTAAYVVGFITLVVPGGLGVREGLLVVLLEPQVGLPAATAVAVGARLLFTLTEIGIAVPFLFVPKGFARV